MSHWARCPALTNQPSRWPVTPRLCCGDVVTSFGEWSDVTSSTCALWWCCCWGRWSGYVCWFPCMRQKVNRVKKCPHENTQTHNEEAFSITNNSTRWWGNPGPHPFFGQIKRPVREGNRKPDWSDLITRREQQSFYRGLYAKPQCSMGIGINLSCLYLGIYSPCPIVRKSAQLYS